MYVGKTVNPAQRLLDHVATSSPPVGPRDVWISSLLKDNDEPVMVIIDSVSDECANDWRCIEDFWISYFARTNPHLTNSTTPSAESRIEVDARDDFTAGERQSITLSMARTAMEYNELLKQPMKYMERRIQIDGVNRSFQVNDYARILSDIGVSWRQAPNVIRETVIEISQSIGGPAAFDDAMNYIKRTMGMRNRSVFRLCIVYRLRKERKQTKVSVRLDDWQYLSRLEEKQDEVKAAREINL